MPRPKAPTFRPTALELWPGDPGDEGELLYHGPIELDGEDLVMTQGGDGSSFTIPDDFVLREVLDVDVDDAESVRQFVEDWGPSGEWGHVSRHDNGNRSTVKSQAEPILILQVLVRHYLNFVEGRPVADAWLDRGGQAVLQRRSSEIEIGPGRQDNERLAWSAWTTYVNKALRVWHMNVAASFAGERYADRGDVDHERLFLTPYHLACRQLAVMACGGEQIRYCANDNCGRPFTRQRGRAQYAARQRGVKYCSHNCAKAQSERERRARRKAES